MQRPGSLSLAPPFHFPDHPASPPVAAASPFGDHSPSAAYPSGSPTAASPGRGPSSIVSYILSHVKLPHCPVSATAFVDRPTLAGALRQQQTDSTQQPTHSPPALNSQQGLEDSSATTAHSAHLHPYNHPYARGLHPPHHRGSLPLPLSLSPHPLTTGGPWQHHVSRSIPAAPWANPPAPSLAAFASSSSASSSLSASPVLSASALHRSQSDSVKLNHSYSLPPPRTSPLPNPPSPAFPSSTASTSSSISHSQLLSTSYDGMSLSPHPSPTGPLVRSTSNPQTDNREDAGGAAAVSAATADGSPQASLVVDVNSLSVLSPATSPNSTLSLPPPVAPSLSPASLTFLDRPMQSWTADEVWTWLHHLNLGQYTLFHHRSIDGDMLLDMTDDDLRTELGVDDKFHRGKILKRIREHADKQQQQQDVTSAAAPSLTAHSAAAGVAGSWADERKDKRERKSGRFQRHRSRASPHHADSTLHSPSPHIVPRQLQRPIVTSMSSLHPRDHHSADGSSIDRYDYYVMQYEVMAALDEQRLLDNGERWEQKSSEQHDTDYMHVYRTAATQDDGSASAAIRRRDGDDEEVIAERVVDEAETVRWSHGAVRGGSLDSPVSSSGSDDEAEEEEREKQRRERHRRRLHRRVSHDKHQTLSAPHSQGSIHRSHSAALSSYWPTLQTSTAPLDNLEVSNRDASVHEQQQATPHVPTTTAAATANSSPPLPSASLPLPLPSQPLAANLSVVSAAFASLTASSTPQSHSSNRHSATGSRTIAASSSLYPPPQQAVKPSMSADSLSSALHVTHSHRSPLPSPSQHSSHSPQVTPAPALSPLPHSHTASHQSLFASNSSVHSHSVPPPHPHPPTAVHSHHHSSQSLPSAAGAAPSTVPSRIDRLSSVLRSSPTFIDEVTNLTILSSGVAGHAYSGSFHSLPVVVKLPKTLEISGQEWREWQCHMRLPPHPNLVRFVGALVMEDNNHLVTELVRQGSLKGVLASGSAAGGLLAVYSSGYAVMRAALDIGRGLSHMHRHHLVHRDISSRNILVDGDGTFVIADLGLCREMNKHDSAVAGGGSAASAAGGEGGDSDQYEMSRSTAIPVRWTSPEALLTSSYTSKSDVWALGVTLWEMTTGGAVPYQWVDGNRRLIQQVVDGTAQLSVDLHWEPTTNIGRRARNIIQLCLTREVDDRPNSTQLVERVEAEMQLWQREAAEEARQQVDIWRTHHEQLHTQWEMDTQEVAQREEAKHLQLMTAAAAADDGSPVAVTGAAVATPPSPTRPGSMDDEELRGLEMMQPTHQRATSKLSHNQQTSTTVSS